MNTIAQKHLGRIISLSWSPDSRRLVSGATDGSAIVWEIKKSDGSLSGSLLRKLQNASIGAAYVHWSADGSKIITTNEESQLYLWSGIDYSPITNAADAALGQVRWNFNTSRLASGGYGGIKVTGSDLTTPYGRNTTYPFILEPEATNIILQTGVYDWSPDGTKIAVVYANTTNIDIRSVSTGNIIQTIDNLPYVPRTMAWNPDINKNYIAIGTNDRVDVINVATETILSTYHIPGKKTGTYMVGWNTSGTQLVYPDIQVGTEMPPIVTPPQSAAMSVTSLNLINADADTSIQTLTSGNTLNLGTLPTRNLNIRADASGSPAKVVFTLNGVPFREDTTAPFSLGDTLGNYAGWTPDVGSYTLTATPYNASNVPGTPLTISFVVTDNE